MTSNRERRLDGKVALVMGGTGGIGRAVAIEFASCGASVSVVGRRVKEGSDVVAEIINQGGNASFVRGDLSDQNEIRFVIENVMEAYGRIDCAFNNAGIEGPLGDLLNHTEQEIKETFDINVHGLAHSMRLQLECMLRQGEGAIVNCASIAGLRGIAGSSVYCATKHAVIGFTKSVALEYAARGIRINAVAPGCIETDMLYRVNKGDYDDLVIKVPMRRLGKPMEVAKAVSWLCSHEASFITGQVLTVDGGVEASL
mgnify:FL=1